MHLVIQGGDVETADLKRLAKICGASRIERLTPEAFRLRDATPAQGLAAACEQAQLDHAFVPSDRLLADFRLLVMDMDSTLIAVETIDELADLAGLRPQVAELTERAMRGEIEYDQSLTQRVAVLKGLAESALDRVYEERVRLNPGAEKLLAKVKRLGVKTLLVSGGFSHVAQRLTARLGLDYTSCNVLEVEDGKLTGEIRGPIVDTDGKRDALVRVRDALGIRRDQVIAIGDGANDLKFMAEAGVSVAYHAKPVVRAAATHAIDHVGLDGVLNLFN